MDMCAVTAPTCGHGTCNTDARMLIAVLCLPESSWLHLRIHTWHSKILEGNGNGGDGVQALKTMQACCTFLHLKTILCLLLYIGNAQKILD